jgi:hypothetical protein
MLLSAGISTPNFNPIRMEVVFDIAWLLVSCGGSVER